MFNGAGRAMTGSPTGSLMGSHISKPPATKDHIGYGGEMCGGEMCGGEM
jgi:hypothetical protein